MRRGISRIAHQHSNLHEIIVPLVNQVGQQNAARQLGVSPFTINRWLKQNGYVLKRQYVLAEREERAS